MFDIKALIESLAPYPLQVLGLQALYYEPALSDEYQLTSLDEAYRMPLVPLAYYGDRDMQAILRELQSSTIINSLWYLQSASIMALMIDNLSRNAGQMMQEDLQWVEQSYGPVAEARSDHRGKEQLACAELAAVLERMIVKGEMEAFYDDLYDEEGRKRVEKNQKILMVPELEPEGEGYRLCVKNGSLEYRGIEESSITCKEYRLTTLQLQELGRLCLETMRPLGPHFSNMASEVAQQEAARKVLASLTGKQIQQVVQGVECDDLLQSLWYLDDEVLFQRIFDEFSARVATMLEQDFWRYARWRDAEGNCLTHRLERAKASLAAMLASVERVTNVAE